MDKITTMLFDFDGTLLDSKTSIVLSFFRLCQKYNPGEYSYRQIEKRFGESFADITAGWQGEKSSEIRKNYIQMMSYYDEQFSALFPGVQENLLKLKLSGFKLGLVTNKEKELTVQGLKRNGLIDYFDYVITVNDVSKPKPSPEPIIRALNILDSKAKETIIFGDTVFDYQAAESAGTGFVALDWYRSYYLLKLRPKHYYFSLDDFIRDYFAACLAI